jgi:hypothetical protein
MAGALLVPVVTFAEDHQIRFGLYKTTGKTSPCVQFGGERLTMGQRMYFITGELEGWSTARIVNMSETECNSISLEKVNSYKVELDEPDKVGMAVGFALVVPAGIKPVKKAGKVILDRGGSDNHITFHECASREGLHFFAKKKNRQLWHEYYYLGYDVMPTCRDEDFKEIK